MTTVNTIANLTTEQIAEYTKEYQELVKQSLLSFDQKAFEVRYEAAKRFYLADEMNFDDRHNAWTYASFEREGGVNFAEHKITASVLCHLAGVLKHKFITLYKRPVGETLSSVASSNSGFPNQIQYFKAMTDFLEENKDDYVLCTDTKVYLSSGFDNGSTVTKYGRGIPVTATKEKQKADLKKLKKVALKQYKEYIEIKNQESKKELSTLEDYIQKQEAKKNAAKLAEIQSQIMKEQQNAIDTAEQDYLLEEDYEYDLVTLANIKADVGAENIPNSFKFNDLVKSLGVSIEEGKIDSIDLTNDKLVSDTLKAQGFEKKHTNTGSVWVVA